MSSTPQEGIADSTATLAAETHWFAGRWWALIGTSMLIGFLDDLQVRFVRIGSLGVGPEVAYQAIFMLASFASAMLVLRNRSWSLTRNLSNLFLGIPVAMIADNTSIDFGTLRPYFMLIPKEGYVWREAVFGNIPVLSQLAYWTNLQSMMPGLLNGYVLAVGLVIAYLAIQKSWSRYAKPVQY